MAISTTKFGLGYPDDPHEEQARREDAARKKKEKKIEKK